MCTVYAQQSSIHRIPLTKEKVKIPLNNKNFSKLLKKPYIFKN